MKAKDQRDLSRLVSDMLFQNEKRRFDALALQTDCLRTILTVCIESEIYSEIPIHIAKAEAFLKLAVEELKTAADIYQSGYNFGNIEEALESAVDILEEFEDRSKITNICLEVAGERIEGVELGEITPLSTGRILWAAQEILGQVRTFQNDLDVRERKADSLRRKSTRGVVTVMWGLMHAR